LNVEFNGKRPFDPIAAFGPANTAPRRLSECRGVTIPHSSSAPDPGFARDLDRIIVGNPSAEPPSWG
jgi:hypothetical protein